MTAIRAERPDFIPSDLVPPELPRLRRSGMFFLLAWSNRSIFLLTDSRFGASMSVQWRRYI